MSELSNSLSEAEVKQIAAKDDFHIAPYRADGETFGTLTWIWSIEVRGKLYVRAYSGTSSRWYTSAMEQGAGKIRAAGMEKKVHFKPVNDKELNDTIDLAYREKYRDSPYLSAMVRERAREATVQVIAWK